MIREADGCSFLWICLFLSSDIFAFLYPVLAPDVSHDDQEIRQTNILVISYPEKCRRQGRMPLG